ncbi:MAG: GNAT family N-acetyltransferase [Oscillospiraceae bacterium]|nr:GNAT family N-acetyltransferase [Oscillospiraceae bacterium]
MEIQIKTFDQLSKEELYAVLKLRVDVFVVEQQCPYADLDGKDLHALHVMLKDEDGIEAYLRILDRGVVSEHVAIGRVIAVKRRCGLASKLLICAIDAARTYFQADKIYLEAQTYARGLYEKQGFRQITEEFLEDGIPHIGMLLELENEIP